MHWMVTSAQRPPRHDGIHAGNAKNDIKCIKIFQIYSQCLG
jgi:hypothetical protein